MRSLSAITCADRAAFLSHLSDFVPVALAASPPPLYMGTSGGHERPRYELDRDFINEARNAARGVFALVMGDRKAAGYFVLTQAGLVASFIAVLVTTALVLIITAALGAGGLFSGLVQNIIVYVGLIGASALYLRQIGRSDALLPFMVALNWSNAILALIMLVVLMLGVGALLLVAMIAGIVISVNIARLIMTLKPLQIVLLIIAQVVGLFFALIVLALVFPPSPEQLAEISAAAGSPRP